MGQDIPSHTRLYVHLHRNEKLWIEDIYRYAVILNRNSLNYNFLYIYKVIFDFYIIYAE